MLNACRWLSLPTSLSRSQGASLFRRFCATATSGPASETTSYLRNISNGAEIFLVGTAHVSKASADEVRQTIRRVQPSSVLVELDSKRAQKLRSGQSVSGPELLRSVLPGLLTPGKGWSGRVFESGLKGLYQAMRGMGLEPGQEMLAAMEEADACGAAIVFGDQEQSVTLSRISQSFGIGDIMKMMTRPQNTELAALLGGGDRDLASSVEALKTRQAATLMSTQMRDSFPGLARALIDERDQVMVDQLRALTGRVVAVVGLAHLDGIEARWRDGSSAGS